METKGNYGKCYSWALFFLAHTQDDEQLRVPADCLPVFVVPSFLWYQDFLARTTGSMWMSLLESKAGPVERGQTSLN